MACVVQAIPPPKGGCDWLVVVLEIAASRSLSFVVDDDELIVRASAVLKSQGPENWSRGRPGLRWARTNSRSARDASCGKIRGKTAGGVTSCDAAGPGYLWYSFRLQMGGRDLSQHIKAFRSGKGVHVRRVSPVPGRLLRDVSAVRQSAIR